MGLVLVAAAMLGGAKGLALFIGLAGFAQLQLLMSDYVQHYGLMRATGADGGRNRWETGIAGTRRIRYQGP